MPYSSSLARSIAVAAVSSSLLGGCVVAVVGAAAGAGGYTMGQERGPGGVASDTEIKTVLNAKWAKDNSAILSYVDLNIFEGRVLLTGDVPNPEIRDLAVADAQKVNGVKEVINDINIGQRSTFGSTSSDTWILTRLRSSITFDGNISSLNYSLQVVDGVVYILGSAKSEDEMNRVINHARNTPDVVRVVSYIRVRPGVGESAPPDDSGSGTSFENTPPPPPPVDNGNNAGAGVPYGGPSAVGAAPDSAPPQAPAYTAPTPMPPTSLSPPASSPPSAPPLSSGPGTVQEQPL